MVMCYVDRLLELIGRQCKFCPLQAKVSARAVGCSLVVKMACSRGHTFSWASSPLVTNSNKSVLYKANLVFASALLLSGNNYYKVLQLCRFMNLKCISPSTYFAYQRLCLTPATEKFYNKEMVSLSVFLSICPVQCYLGACNTRPVTIQCDCLR